MVVLSMFVTSQHLLGETAATEVDRKSSLLDMPYRNFTCELSGILPSEFVPALIEMQVVELRVSARSAKSMNSPKIKRTCLTTCTLDSQDISAFIL